MSLFNSYDRTKFLGEVQTPLETQGQGVLTTAQQQAKILVNLGIGTLAELGVLTGVTPGTAAANKAVVLGAGKNISTITSATITTLTSTTVNSGVLNATSSVLSSGAAGGIGYATGAGGTVAQATSKATGVSLNALSGAITLNAAALASDAIVSFVLTNTSIAATDVVVLNHISGGTVGSYTLNAQAAAGSATINVANRSAGSLSEAIVIQFAVIKAVNA